MFEIKPDPKAKYLNRKSTRWLYFNGITLHLTGWSEVVGINMKTLSNRLNRLGWNIDKSLSTPVRERNNQRLKEIL